MTAECGIPTMAASKWWKANNLPISQFYHVSVDDADPYQRLRRVAGQQLLGRRVGISRRHHQLASGKIVWNGDGFYTFADPADPDYIYAEYQGGYVGRVNRHTHRRRAIIQPEAELQGKAALQLEHSDGRFRLTRKGRSTSARNSFSARAITARAGNGSRRT